MSSAPSTRESLAPSAGRGRRWRLVAAGALLVWLPEVFLPMNWLPPGTSAWVYAGDELVFLLAYALHGLVFLVSCERLDPWVDARRGLLRTALAAIATLAVIAATFALTYELIIPATLGVVMQARDAAAWALHVGAITLVLYALRASYRAGRQRTAALERFSAEAEDLEATIARSELALLEMQVEPHFLFNTLAHVRRDLQHAPPQAVQMLDALIDHLERAGPALRRADWTIGDELDLVQTYLRLVRHRFGERLRVVIEAPPALQCLPLPALAIATLVENAIQHGLAPKAEGGTLRVLVSADAQAPGGVCIQVVDDGVGLRASQGTGLGLATVRARLRAAFGPRAALTIESSEEGAGVQASIRIAAHA